MSLTQLVQLELTQKPTFVLHAQLLVPHVLDLPLIVSPVPQVFCSIMLVQPLVQQDMLNLELTHAALIPAVLAQTLKLVAHVILGSTFQVQNAQLVMLTVLHATRLPLIA